jgi:hypothetical protein
MTERKTFLRHEHLGGQVFTAAEFRYDAGARDTIAAFAGGDDELARSARDVLESAAKEYIVSFGVYGKTNKEFAVDLNRNARIGEAIDRLLASLEHCSGEDLTFPRSLRAFVPVDPSTRETEVGFERDLTQVRSILQGFSRAAADNIKILSEPYPPEWSSPKERLISSALKVWVRTLGRDVPPSGSGPVAEFVLATCNPILRLGGQQISNANSARSAVRKAAKRIGLL